MSRTPPGRPDQRRYLRVPVRVEIHSAGEEFSSDYAINISKSGMCLQCAEPHPPGRALCLRFQLCPADDWIELLAEVIWCTDEIDLSPGMTYHEVGVRFASVPEKELAMLRAFVDKTARYCSIDDPGPGSSFGWSG